MDGIAIIRAFSTTASHSIQRETAQHRHTGAFILAMSIPSHKPVSVVAANSHKSPGKGLKTRGNMEKISMGCITISSASYQAI
jgi:hypothetical protein